MLCFKIIRIIFNFVFLPFWGGSDWWLKRKNCHLSMKRKTLLEYFSPNPDWTFLTHPCLKLLFLILHPILPAAWSFIFTIILSLIIMPNVAQWSLIVIYRAPIPNFKNCFPDKKVYRQQMIYLLIPVLTRDDVLSSYNRIWLARFGPIETRQSNV